LLSLGEPEKALDWTTQAAVGVPGDRFLMEQLFTREEEAKEDPGGLQVLYFLKVIEVFDQFGYGDFIVDLASTALDICDGDNPNRVRSLKLIDAEIIINMVSKGFLGLRSLCIETVPIDAHS